MFKRVLKNANESAVQFNIFDWLFFVICLIGIGVLIGIYFYSFFIKYIKIVGFVALITFIYIMYSLFVKRHE